MDDASSTAAVAAGYERPATARQVAELARLALKWGKPPPRDGLSWDEADVAIRAMRNYRAMEAKAIPPPDLDMQPNETLRGWTPFRRRGQGRREGEQLA